MKATYLIVPAVAALLLVGAGSVRAQGTLPKLKEEKPGLAARAHISADSATRIAQAAVRDGRVAAREIEEEDGRLIYSFDMKVAGKSGIEEVNVDAMTGATVGVEHESPATEAKESRADSAHKRSAKAEQGEKGEKAQKAQKAEKDDD